MAYNFDTIAARYDCMNHLMTCGLDRLWRRRAAKVLRRGCRGEEVLDVACGTGDMACEIARRGCSVVGVDLSGEMLAIAKSKLPDGCWRVADAERLPFDDDSFGGVCCAFGVRNFVNLDAGLREMLRVLQPDGAMVILELSTPDLQLVRLFYNFYAQRVIPFLGRIVAGNRAAYTYLPQSIERFPKGEAFCRRIEALGASATCQSMTMGVCRLYTIRKQKGTSL